MTCCIVVGSGLSMHRKFREVWTRGFLDMRTDRHTHTRAHAHTHTHTHTQGSLETKPHQGLGAKPLGKTRVCVERMLFSVSGLVIFFTLCTVYKTRLSSADAQQFCLHDSRSRLQFRTYFLNFPSPGRAATPCGFPLDPPLVRVASALTWRASRW